MTSDQAQTSIPENHPESDLKNCRMRKVGSTGLVECLTEGVWCRWAMFFGNSRFCNNPSAKQPVNSNHP